MASDWQVAKVVVATVFAKIANDEATRVASSADVPHVGLIECDFGSSSDEEDVSAKIANRSADQPSEASHHTTTTSRASPFPWSGFTLENFSKTCERLDNKFLEKLDNSAAAAERYVDMCSETLDNWRAAADRSVDNLRLVERYSELDGKIGQKVSESVDVVGQKVSVGVESLAAQIGQKVGNGVDQAKRSGAFQVATQQKDRAHRLFDSSAKQLRASLPSERLDADLIRSKESAQRNFDSLRNQAQAAVIGLPSKLRSMGHSGGA